MNVVSSKRRSMELTTIYIIRKHKNNGAQLNQPGTFKSMDAAQLESNSANKM